MRLSRSACVAFVALLSLACASSGRNAMPEAALVPPMPRDEPRLHLELIERMLEGGKPYAAMAHLDTLEPEIAARPDARLLRGETLRRIGRPDEARAIYTSLLATDSAALSRRGLGLLAAGAGDFESAIEELRRARDLEPTIARIRNDLGYALLQQGAFEEAHIELVTAMQLGSAERAVRNLVLLHLVSGDVPSAERIASMHHIPPAVVSRLWHRAQRMRSQPGSGHEDEHEHGEVEREEGDGT